MISVIQRVSRASVTVDGRIIGEIAHGLVALTAIHPSDTDDDCRKTADKLLTLRVFRHTEKAYHLDLTQVDEAGLLVVPNFTVAADVSSGRRPSLHLAASPGEASARFDKLVDALRSRFPNLQTGQFGADMLVEIHNDGPLTVIYDTCTK
jgi:D-tyrosyl-tRNA(Tyr) deacylase